MSLFLCIPRHDCLEGINTYLLGYLRYQTTGTTDMLKKNDNEDDGWRVVLLRGLIAGQLDSSVRRWNIWVVDLTKK